MQPPYPFATAVILALAAAVPAGALAADRALPDPTSPAYCQAVQEIMANTRQQAEVTVFDNMDDYRGSKPEPDPLKIFQVVTYDDKRPVMVSCKVKAADHLRAVYGETAAGNQEICAAVTRLTRAQAVRELEQEYPEAAAERARNFVIDENEPSLAGQTYLSEFELSYTDSEGRVHIQSPGLQTDWDNWLIWLFPNRLRGQTYCHLATVPYMKALATGAVEPGTVMVTTDDAQTTPPY
ncbi:MAG: hypothetical protein V2J12_08495 [Gammaproteobacteria bacterium]|jgi:hypothetical protein|nr:hypothetical protein [Gammaproteobacteria bacterium]